MSRYFVDLDGADEPTIFDDEDLTALGDPAVVVRKAELPGPHADLLWSVLVGVLTADDETVERVATAIHTVRCVMYPKCTEPPDSARVDARAVLTALAEGR